MRTREHGWRVAAGLALAACLWGCATDVSPLASFEPFEPPDGGVGPSFAEIELGRHLFFDKELSGNRNISCATCHVPFLTTTEFLPLSLGEGAVGVGTTRQIGNGLALPRNTSDLFHKGGSDVTALFWDGRVSVRDDGSLEGPVDPPPGLSDALAFASVLPLLVREEMRGATGSNELADIPDSEPLAVWQAIVRRLHRIDSYRAAFELAFGRPEVTIAEVGSALAAFQESLWGVKDSPFDVHRAQTTSEARGEALFFGDAGCARCHNGPLLSDQRFYNLAVPHFGPGKGADGLDEGRAEVTGRPEDRFRFRTPPLRNVAMTPPYMHNGAFDSIRDAILHHVDPLASLRSYDGSSLPPTLRETLKMDEETLSAIESTFDAAPLSMPRALTDRDLFELEAFLNTLTSPAELTKPANIEAPPFVPSNLTPDLWPGGPHPLR